MAWIVIGTALPAIIFGLWIGFKLGKPKSSSIERLSFNIADDRYNYLTVLRRELANFLIRHSPDRYLQLYEQIHLEIESLKELPSEVLETRFEYISKKYPQYKDFDGIQTRDYVLYTEAFDWRSMKQLEEQYSDMILFIWLQTRLKDWQNGNFHTTSEEELSHLREYIFQIKDTILYSKLEQAIHEWRLCNDVNDDNSLLVFETEEYTIQNVEHFAERRYGVHLKNTNEYGLYSLFYSDDNKLYENFYRSDSSFENEECLDPLNSLVENRFLGFST